VSPESIFATSLLLKQIVRRRHLASGKMLDVGCATKPYAALFADRVETHFGVDVPFTYHSKGTIDAFAPSHALPFRNGSFDFVLCTEVLEHVPDPEKSWAEIARVLKPGGVALVTTPFIYRLHEMPYDFWRITPPAHRMMVERAGLAVDEIACRGGYIAVLVDTLLKGLIYLTRGIRRVLRRPQRPGPVTRAVFAMIQWPLAAVLSNERMKSDEYTIGFVVVAKKPRYP
jgi:SAM-dependent methyltransferase